MIQSKIEEGRDCKRLSTHALAGNLALVALGIAFEDHEAANDHDPSGNLLFGQYGDVPERGGCNYAARGEERHYRFLAVQRGAPGCLTRYGTRPDEKVARSSWLYCALTDATGL